MDDYRALLYSPFLFSGSVNAAATPKVNAIVICGNPANKGCAKKIHKLLKTNKYLGYENNTAVDPVLYDSYETVKKGGISRKKIEQKLDYAFSGSGIDDINILYYIGHGYRDNHSTYYEYGMSLATNGDKYYNYQLLAQKLSRYKGKFITILDSCFSDEFYQYGVMRGLSEEDQNRFTCVACTSEKYQSPLLSYFSNHWLSGCGYNNYTQLPADSDKDGFISLEEAYDYSISKAKNEWVLKIKKKDVKYVDIGIHDNAGLKDYPLFQHADVQTNKSTITMWKTQSPEDSITVKNVYTVKSNPKKTHRFIRWKSSNSKVAVVENFSSPQKDNKYNLMINTRKAGNATLTGYLTSSKYSEKCIGTNKIQIKVNVIKIITKLDKKSLTLNLGSTKQLKATVDGPSKTIKWKSSDESIATVSKKGLITAKKAGNAVITATANKVSAECKINVVPSDVVINPQNGNYYKLFNISYTWTDAKAECEAVGGHLVTITDKAKMRLSKL